MSVIMTEGCDLYGTDEAKAELYGWERMEGGQEDCLTTGGRFNGPCFSMEYNHNGWRWKFAKTGVTTIWAHGSFSYGTLQAFDSNYGIRQFDNPSGTLMGRVKLNTSAQIEIYDADNTLQDTSTLTTSVDTYYSCQVKLIAHATTGSIEVWIDGVQWAIASNIDTMPASGDQYVGQVTWGTIKNGSFDYIDDLAIWDNAGSNWNDWTAGKDLAFETNIADAVGNLSQWTKSAGTSNYENVDDSPDHNADTDYNHNATPGNADRINMGSMSAAVDTIYNVRTRVVARKEDAGVASIKVGVYANVTEDVSAAQPLATDYRTYYHDNEINPDDSAAWAIADINALQGQYEVA